MSAEQQTEKLADFILKNYSGEIFDGGAGDVAIEIIKKLDKKNSIKKMNDMVDIQGQDGNWNYNEYMFGMYNGMEFMLSLAEDREPNYKSSPEQWLEDKNIGEPNSQSTK